MSGFNLVEQLKTCMGNTIPERVFDPRDNHMFIETCEVIGEIATKLYGEDVLGRQTFLHAVAGVEVPSATDQA